MSGSTTLATAMILSAALVLAASAQDSTQDPSGARQDRPPEPQVFLRSLVGSWEGTCRTWFRPDELADESAVQGEFQLLLGDRFLRHAYTGSLQGKPRAGEETIAFNPAKNKFQAAWMDDFHMNYGIMFSEGDRTPSGFVVVGEYDVGPDQPPWRWKTVYELAGADSLTITAYNVTPDGTEVKAVETQYVRKRP